LISGSVFEPGFGPLAVIASGLFMLRIRKFFGW
jgi:hypothetical protein